MDAASRRPGTVELLRELLFAQASLDDWAAHCGGSDELRRSFEQARMLMRAGRVDQAVDVWRSIALGEPPASRYALQAWHFVRQAGSSPPGHVAQSALGAIAEVPVQGAHDILAAYADGTARYVNYSGKSIVWEAAGTVVQVQTAIDRWLDVARVMAKEVGPWGKAVLPSLPVGHVRVVALTPSGPRFGQGPGAELSAYPIANSFLGAATGVMQLLVNAVGRPDS